MAHSKPKQSRSSLDDFVMFAKDRAAFEAMISIKVQDNSGGEVSKAVREELIKLRTFRMEYDIGIRKGKLPGCFAREFGMEVAPFVMLRDPCQNEFEVAVEKKNGKVYFTHGWASLKGFYDILGCAWLTIFYANRNLFFIRGEDRKENELDYPVYNPPKRFLLRHTTPTSSLSTNIPNAPSAHFIPKSFFHRMVKELTDDDVASGKLKLPWLGFCQMALPAEETDITIVDYLGYSWKCWFKFSEDDGEVSCMISGQWINICRARKFAEGTTVTFGVTGSSNNVVMYIAPPSMLVLRTKIKSSAIPGGAGPVYHLEQFFWNN